MSSHIESVLATLPSVSKNEAIEVELRVLIDKRLKMPKFIKNTLTSDKTIEYYKKFVGEFCGPCVEISTETPIDKNIISITETINFIQEIKTTHHQKTEEQKKKTIIKQLKFKNGVQQKNELKLYSKENLVEPIFITDEHEFAVKLGVNKETALLMAPDMKFQYDYCRVKLRFSIWPDVKKYPNLNGWRIDITLIKSSTSDISIPMLKRLRDTLFVANLTAKNFVEKVPWNYADSIEMEIEYIGDNPKSITEASIGAVLDTINKIVGVDDQSSLYEVANAILPHKYRQMSHEVISLKTITPQVIELSKQKYFSDIKPNINNFWMTDKADGIRSIIIVEPVVGKMRVINNKTQIIEIPKSDIKKCMADCEFVQFSDEKIGIYIFDVIMYDGKSVINEEFSKRKSYISGFEKIAPKLCFSKEFVKLSDDKLKEQITVFYKSESNRPYETDGLIFTEDHLNYSETNSYKWKPVEKMSIDFLVKKCPKQLLGIHPYNDTTKKDKEKEKEKEKNKKDKETLYILFCGINQKQFERLNLSYIDYYKQIFLNTHISPTYFPIQFSPSDAPFAYLYWSDKEDLDGKIVELTYTQEEEKWNLYRIREDRKSDVETGKYFGNNIAIAETIWQNYKNPLTLEMLTEDTPKSYFQEHESELHKADRAFNRYVHSQLFDEYMKGAEWVIDLGSGKGQDLFRYASMGIKNILFLEKDKDAITELLNRKHQYAKDIKHKFKKHKTNEAREKMSIYVKELDLNEPWEKNIARIKASGIPIPNTGVPVIFCGFALHYMLGNAAQITNITKFINYLLSSEGKFVYTAFDGKTVFQRLTDGKGRYTETENNIMKYDIKQKYKSSDFTGINQAIDVLLPFSSGDYYTEYLISNELLIKYFKKLKIEQDDYKSFSIYFKDFEKHNKRHILSKIDKTYLEMYYFAVYKKI